MHATRNRASSQTALELPPYILEKYGLELKTKQQTSTKQKENKNKKPKQTKNQPTKAEQNTHTAAPSPVCLIRRPEN